MKTVFHLNKEDVMNAIRNYVEVSQDLKEGFIDDGRVLIFFEGDPSGVSVDEVVSEVRLIVE